MACTSTFLKVAKSSTFDNTGFSIFIGSCSVYRVRFGPCFGTNATRRYNDCTELNGNASAKINQVATELARLIRTQKTNEHLVFIVHKMKHCPDDVGAARDGQFQEMFDEKTSTR